MNWNYFLDEHYITHACIYGGYKINDGDLKGLTNLQKIAISIIIDKRMKIANENELIGAITL